MIWSENSMIMNEISWLRDRRCESCWVLLAGQVCTRGLNSAGVQTSSAAVMHFAAVCRILNNPCNYGVHHKYVIDLTFVVLWLHTSPYFMTQQMYSVTCHWIFHTLYGMICLGLSSIVSENKKFAFSGQKCLLHFLWIFNT